MIEAGTRVRVVDDLDTWFGAQIAGKEGTVVNNIDGLRLFVDVDGVPGVPPDYAGDTAYGWPLLVEEVEVL